MLYSADMTIVGQAGKPWCMLTLLVTCAEVQCGSAALQVGPTGLMRCATRCPLFVAGRYNANNKILSFVFCNGLRKKKRFQNFQNVEFDPGRLQVFGTDLAQSFVWLKHQGV